MMAIANQRSGVNRLSSDCAASRFAVTRLGGIFDRRPVLVHVALMRPVLMHCRVNATVLMRVALMRPVLMRMLQKRVELFVSLMLCVVAIGRRGESDRILMLLLYLVDPRR